MSWTVRVTFECEGAYCDATRTESVELELNALEVRPKKLPDGWVWTYDPTCQTELLYCPNHVP